MPLCGSQIACGCALSSIPSEDSEIGGAFPTITVDGAGTALSPWLLSVNPEWTDAVVDGLRRPVVANTGTAYTPVVADENTMITLSNAGAITVTLPQNSVAAFPIGAEIDFVWLGVGQPTFVAGTGATIVSTPGLKLTDRYSVATAKKISTNGWLLLGRLSA
jgi:hypothetical protein